MSELTPQANYSLQKSDAVDRERAKPLISGLFVNLQSQSKGGLTGAVVAGYLEAVQDVPEWALEQAAEMYRTGKRGNGKFVPMPAELAKCARELVEAKAERERHKQQMKMDTQRIASQIAEQQRLKDFHANKSQDSIQRVKQMREKQKQEWEREEAEYEASKPQEESISKRTQNRFAAQARASLLKTLEAQNA